MSVLACYFANDTGVGVPAKEYSLENGVKVGAGDLGADFFFPIWLYVYVHPLQRLLTVYRYISRTSQLRDSARPSAGHPSTLAVDDAFQQRLQFGALLLPHLLRR